MNIIYRIVRNATTGKWTVASEFAKGRGKQPSRRAWMVGGLFSLTLAAATGASEPPAQEAPVCMDEQGITVACAAVNAAAIGVFADTDPVNVGQLRGSVQSVADALGGGAGVDAAGVLAAPSYMLGGSTYTNVGSALTGLDARVTSNEEAIANIPNGSRFISAFNGSGTAASTPTGPNSLAVGQGAYAGGNGANAFGTNARAAANGAFAVGAGAQSSSNNASALGYAAVASGGGSTAIGASSRSAAASAVAIGQNATAASVSSTAIGQGSNIAAASTGSVAIGNASTITASATNAVALGTQSRVTAANASALGDQAQATASNAVAIGSASLADRIDSVSFGTVGAERQLVNVADATEATDAVNLGQLRAAASSAAAAFGGGAGVNADGTVSAPSYTVADLATGGDATVDNVGDALVTINSSVLNVDGRLSALSTAIDAGTVGLVQQADASADVTVAAASAGSRVDFSGTAGARVLDGVADGALAAGSQQAVNGSQLQATNAQVLNNTTTIANLQDGLSGATRYVKANGLGDGSDDAQATGLGAIAVGRLATAGTDAVAVGNAAHAQGAASMALGAGASAAGAGSVALGAGSVADRDNAVSVGAGPLIGNGTRQIINVANGTENTDAVSVQQLRPLVSALGGGAALNATTGAVTDPRYSVQGTTHDNVGDALDGVDATLTSLDGRVTTAEGDITTINTVLGNLTGGTAGLVQQTAADAVVTVAAGSGGSSVDFSGTAGARQLKGVADGAATTDAVNVGQLPAAIDGVRGGDTRYFKASGNNDGSDDAVAIGDGAMAAGASAQANGAGSVALGQGAQAQADNSIALGANAIADRANTVAVGAAGAERQITHVADGSEDTDAVNLRQLKAAGLIGDAGQSLDAVVYDQDSHRAQVTFAGAGGTVLANVADGRIGAGSREAVNGGQVAALRDQLQDRIGDIDNRVTHIENNPGTGGGDNPYYDASAAGGSTVVPADAGNVASNGGPATATGQGAVAAGAGANASANGSVALGAGAVADREATVSVGRVGGERQITHVAAGVQGTDAVNVSQLNERMADANAYTDGRMQDMWDNVNDRFDHASRQANRGIAGAAALVQVTPYLPGKTVLNAGMATYRGETALGVGVSRWSDNGRVNVNAGVSAARGDRPIFRVGVGVVLGD